VIAGENDARAQSPPSPSPRPPSSRAPGDEGEQDRGHRERPSQHVGHLGGRERSSRHWFDERQPHATKREARVIITHAESRATHTNPKIALFDVLSIK